MASKRVTIYEIKRGCEKSAPKYFDRKTLKFWGQRLRDFSVYKTDQPNVYRTACLWHSGGCEGLSEAFWRDNGDGTFTRVRELIK